MPSAWNMCSGVVSTWNYGNHNNELCLSAFVFSCALQFIDGWVTGKASDLWRTFNSSIRKAFLFIMWCYALHSADYAITRCHPSVCHMAGIMLKRLNISSNFFTVR